jgi:primosomal replication protein N
MVQVAAGDRLLVFVGHPQLALLFQVLLAVGGALTIFQSFTVKVSNFKVVDLGQFVDQYRASVYSAITEEVVRQRKRRDQVLAERLAKQAVGSVWTFQGFLATPRQGKSVVLHVQEFQQD